VQNIRFLSVRVALAFAAALVIAGCSSVKQQNNENVREAVDKAQRLAQRGFVLMANPHYVDTKTGQAAPLQDALPGSDKAKEAVDKKAGLEQEASRLELPGLDEVNPDALKSLDEAQKVLETALTDNGQADEAEKAMAKSWLSHILKLKGEYNWHRAASEYRKVAPALEQVDHQLMIARIQASTIKMLDSLLSMGTKQVEDMATSSKAAEKDLAQKGEELSKQIADLKSKTQELTAAVESERTKSSQIERDCREVADSKAVEMFDQAMAVRDETDKKAGELQDLEFKLEGKQDELKANELSLGLVRAQVAAADQALKGRQGMVGSTTDGRKNAEEGLKKAREATVAAMTQAIAAFTASQQSQVKAISLTSDAIKQLSQATSQESLKLHALSQQGAMGLDLGSLNMEVRAGASRIIAQLQQLDQAWKDLGGAGELPAAPKVAPEDYRVAAVTAFKDATVVCEKAISALGRTPEANNIRWVYQGSAVAAYRALARVSPEDRAEATSKADALQENAKAQREASPYLENVTKLSDAK